MTRGKAGPTSTESDAIIDPHRGGVSRGGGGGVLGEPDSSDEGV